MGRFNEALHKQCGGKIPITKAIEVMARELDPSGAYLRYGHEGRRRWIESTPECAESYGVKAWVPLPAKPDLSGALPTEDEPEYPN